MSEAVLSKWRDRAAEAEANRQTFTFAAQIVDELAADGIEARMTHASQDGREIGKRGEPGVPGPHVIESDLKLKFFLDEKHDRIARKKAGVRA